MANINLNECGIALLSSAEENLTATGATTLYTVPVGKKCILDSVRVIAGTTGAVAGASPTAVATVGQSSALTDFLAANTFTNLAATGDMVICRPVPATTPLKSKVYAAGTVIQMNVTTADADGCTNNTVLLFGTLFDA